MKKLLLLMTILIVPISIGSIYAQTTCKVLLPRIGDSYTGECKQGLADGAGEAFGVDQYKGEFRKGLPEGIGTYIWQTGDKYEGSWKRGLRDGDGTFTFQYMGRDSVLAGAWKADKFIGKKDLPAYVIQYRSNIGRVSVLKMGDHLNYVRIKFSSGRDEGSMYNVSALTLQGSSGTESLTGNFNGFESVSFPFEGKARFTVPSQFNTASLNCELRFVINEPGAWTVTIFY